MQRTVFTVAALLAALVCLAGTASAQIAAAGIVINQGRLAGGRCTDLEQCAGCATEVMRIGYCINRKTIRFLGRGLCGVQVSYQTSDCSGPVWQQAYHPCGECVPGPQEVPLCAADNSSLQFVSYADDNCTTRTGPGATLTPACMNIGGVGVRYLGVVPCERFVINDHYDHNCTLFWRKSEVVGGGEGVCNGGAIVHTAAYSGAAHVSAVAVLLLAAVALSL